MRKYLSTVAIALCTIAVVTSCKKETFDSAYGDPSTVSNAPIDRQFAGMIYVNREFVVPSYWDYFVVKRITVNRFTQAVGWANSINQYVPGGAAITDRWNNYYNLLAQYRELQKIYNGLSDGAKKDNRIYYIIATIYFYDQTQKVVDLHGDIPWADAGKLSTNAGDYTASYAKYQSAESIYTTMLDDLKAYSDELSTIAPTINSGVLNNLKSQDLINKGDISLWQKYCNSLRIRMLMRASGASAFTARSNQEISTILGNAAKYPIVATNADNIQIKIYNLSSDIHSKGFQTGLEDWNGNIAGKTMIDNMKTNADPRLRAIFEPGASAGGVYNGLDQSLDAGAQTNLINGGTIAIYNRSTISRNQFFPGMLIDAAEINLLLAEYYLKAGNDAMAKARYESGITESVNFYYGVRALSNDNTAGALTPTSPAEIATYLAKPAISWALALTTGAKLSLIGSQKWLNYNVIQPNEGWAEMRRLDLPALTFPVDNSSSQKNLPLRWVYPSSEIAYNGANYAEVKAKDNLTTKIFWDIN